jgi:hypothetical protein
VEDHSKILKSPSFGTSATISANIQQPVMNFNVFMEKPDEDIDNKIKKAVIPSAPDDFIKDKPFDKMVGFIRIKCF